MSFDSSPSGGQPTFVSSPQGQPSGGGKSLLWIVIVVLVLLIVPPLICCGGCAMLGWTGYSMVKAPVEAAVTELAGHPEVIEKLGTPVKEEVGFGVNNYQNNNGNGSADIDLRVRGPNGTARVSGKMQLRGGNWSSEQIEVSFDDGTKLNLP